MTSKLYIIFVVKKMVPMLFNFTKFIGKNALSQDLGFTFFSMTLSKNTCSNKLGLTKSPDN